VEVYAEDYPYLKTTIDMNNSTEQMTEVQPFIPELDSEYSLEKRLRRPSIRKIKRQERIAQCVIQKCVFEFPGAVDEPEELEPESEEKEARVKKSPHLKGLAM
jgi:hypothetical protein